MTKNIRINPFDHALAVWDMKDKTGRYQFPYNLDTLGEVVYKELDGQEKEASWRRGSDGYIAVFKNGCLLLNSFVSNILRPKRNEYSLYIRTRLSEEPFGYSRTLFCTDHVIVTQHPTGLMTLLLSQKITDGTVFREIPLCAEKMSGWLDLVIVIGEDKIRYFSQGKLKQEISLKWDIYSVFRDEMVIGGFKSNKPDTNCGALPSANFNGNAIDTVAIWHEMLKMEEIAFLSDCDQIDLTLPQDRLSYACRLYAEHFDASVAYDVENCVRVSKMLYGMAREDKNRPRYHLTQPMGYIFDPAGAFYHDGKYHVFSYHNTNFLLEYSSLDHYVSEDLLHWDMWPMFHANSEHDFFCIYLMNHFIDEEGRVRVLYTGQGMEGKRGIIAQSDDGLVSYTNRYPAITKYHHDGHVFRHGDRWYTITSRMCKMKRQTPLGDAVMMWSSEDLIEWKEEGEIFCRIIGEGNEGRSKKTGFMEFPYLLNFGEKDVLILGGWPVDYWVGKFDWSTLKFIPDEKEGKLLDQVNHFHCFNPLCVDQDAEGKERRILMALYNSIGAGKYNDLPWSCTHVVPRKLSLEENYLRQDPVEELKQLRGGHNSFNDLSLSRKEVFGVSKDTSSLEILAEFERNSYQECSTTGRFGIALEFDCAKKEQKAKAVISYDPNKGTFTLEGDVNNTGTAPSYLKDAKRIEIRIFVDRQMLEIFINGQSMSTAMQEYVQDHCYISVFAEEMETVCKKLDIWKLELK